METFEQQAENEISWFFNDINLSMVMIILFFAVIFATMVSNTANQSAQNQNNNDTRMPTELSASNFFGEIGFPQASEEKGFPTKETFNEDLIIIEKDTDRKGMEGNRVWEFEELSRAKNKKLVTINVSTEGQMQLDGQAQDMDSLKRFIDSQAEVFHVFVRIEISQNAPMVVYKDLRDQLWNDSDATHWEFITTP